MKNGKPIPAGRADEIRREQVRLAISQTPTMQSMSYLVAVIVSAVLWKYISAAQLAAWMALVTLVAGSRMFLWSRFRPRARTLFDGRTWGKYYTALTFISGLAWGSSALFLYPPGNIPMQALLIIVMASLSASVTVSHSSVKSAPAVWICPTMLSYAARLILDGGEFGLFVGVLAVIYTGTLVSYSLRIHRTITGSIALRFENLDLLEEVRQATQLKDRFVSLVSHDLRSPLANISSMAAYAGQMEQQEQHRREAVKIFEMVRANANTLISLIDRLLDISLLQSGKMAVMKKTVAPRAIAEGKIALLRHSAEGKNIAIVNDLPPTMRVLADPALYGEVIGNLIVNAIKFSKPGGMVRIFATAESPPAVAVEDNGVGIHPELARDLFRHEVKTNTYGTAGETGSGFGLPYSMDIIKAHGGGISVSSEPGKGATFTVHLPVSRSHILVVDEKESRRRSIKDLLAGKVDAQFAEADNAPDALNEALEAAPDLIISGLPMPAPGGADLLAALKSDPRVANVPVIIAINQDDLSAPETLKLREGLFAEGASDFIMEPVTEEDVLPRVRRFLPNP